MLLQELIKKFALKSPEERAYTIIKAHLQAMETSEDTSQSEQCRALFREWMLLPDTTTAKERALERVFDEMTR